MNGLNETNPEKDVTPTTEISQQSAVVGQGLDAESGVKTSLEDRVQALTESLRQLPAVAHAFTMLEQQLPEGIWYHDVAHSTEVFEDVVKLAVVDSRSEKEIELLAIAAAFHDTGFIDTPVKNEPIGAEYAAKAMKAYGYSDAEIATVGEAIMATQMQPVPEKQTLEQRKTNELSRYLLDADLSNFGKAIFPYKTVSVYNEIFGGNAHSIQDMANPEGVKYLEGTSRLLAHHEWQTEAAKSLYAATKADNTAIISEVTRLFKKFVDVDAVE